MKVQIVKRALEVIAVVAVCYVGWQILAIRKQNERWESFVGDVNEQIEIDYLRHARKGLVPVPQDVDKVSVTWHTLKVVSVPTNGQHTVRFVATDRRILKDDSVEYGFLPLSDVASLYQE